MSALRTSTICLLLALLIPLSSAEAISGTALDGSPLRVDPAEGPVLLVFWASWCGSCRREMPGISALHARAGSSLRVIGVSIDTEVADARKAAAGAALPYPILADPQMTIADRFAVAHTPVLILLGRDGTELGRGSSLGRLREPLAALGQVLP